jgi:hypothetical protein
MSMLKSAFILFWSAISLIFLLKNTSLICSLIYIVNSSNGAELVFSSYLDCGYKNATLKYKKMMTKRVTFNFNVLHLVTMRKKNYPGRA